MWAYNYTNELYHYGVKGMKWGVRKKYYNSNGSLNRLGQAKQNYKTAKKEYNKAYNAAYNYSQLHPITQLYGKGKAKSNALWEDMQNKKDSYSKAKTEYKQTKKDYKETKHKDESSKISEKDIRDFRELMDTKYSSNKAKRDLYRNMTDEELREDIEKKQKIKKTIVTAAAVVGLSAAAYMVYRNHCAANLQKKLTENEALKNLLEDGLDSAIPESAKASVKKVLNDSLDDVSVVLDPGSKIHRMVGFKDFDLEKAGKSIYASFEPRDIDAYKALLKDWSGTGERYDVALEVTKRIKAPTIEKAKEIFDKLYNENPEYKKALKETLVNTYSSFKPHVLKSYISSQVERELQVNPFSKGIYAMVRGGADSDMLSNAYRKAGYDAIVDYFDKGTLANTPLILLDPKGTLRKTGETFVTKNDKVDSLFRLFEDGHISTQGLPTSIIKKAERYISKGDYKRFKQFMELLGIV